MSTTKFWDRINYIHGNRYLELISQLPVEKTEEFCAQITMNPIVQMRHIEEHPELPWDWTTVCHNPNFTQEMYFRNLDKGWDHHILTNSPHCLDIFRKYPDKDWDYVGLTISAIEYDQDNCSLLREFPDKPWEYNYFCDQYDYINYHQDFNEKIFIKNPDLPWDWLSLEKEESISNSTILLDPTEITDAKKLDNYTNAKKLDPHLEFDWDVLSFRYDAKVIEKNLHLPWNFLELSSRKDINIDIILKNTHLDWRFSVISRNNNSLNLKKVVENPKLDWCWRHIGNRFINHIKTLEKYPNLPWDYNELLRKPKLGKEMFRKYRKKKWHIPTLINCKWFNIKMIYKIKRSEVCWDSLSCCKNIKMSIVRQHLDLPWDWKWLSLNENIDVQMVLDFPDKPWDWSELSRKLGIDLYRKGTPEIREKINYGNLLESVIITFDDYQEIKDRPINYNYLILHTFDEDRDKLIETEARKHMAIYKIKKAWKKCYYSPQTEIGRRRLNRDYNNLFGDSN